MARTCTICSHPRLVNIDRQLLRGDMLTSIPGMSADEATKLRQASLERRESES